MKRIAPVLSYILLALAIGGNLWLYRLEPTALGDPNDNTFQFALVERTNQIWDWSARVCGGLTKPVCMLTYLSDHWVPNWAQGYNLPYYYSHVPQIAIVSGWRLIAQPLTGVSLFSFYHGVIYLLLSLFPLSVYLAVTVTGMGPVAAGFGALATALLATDGLYGLDPSSFVWRGYGLSSQLMAAVWFPLAVAYAWRLLVKRDRVLFPAVAFLTLTTAGHLGLGIMAFLAAGLIAVSEPALTFLRMRWRSDTNRRMLPLFGTLLALFSVTGLILGYWILPTLAYGNYHNISIWDGIWKFDSFGFLPVLSNLANGALFDFGRFPVLTLLAGIGLFAGLSGGYAAFSFLFAAFLLLYFGRTTWGGLVDMLPGMSEFHMSRFVVGVHLAGLFLIPLGAGWLIRKLETLADRLSVRGLRLLVSSVVAAVVIALAAPQTIRYAAHNDTLIERANGNYRQGLKDADALISLLKTETARSPGRVYAGRGGTWGNSFKIAETAMFMHLSTYGIPVVLWLPETWSPNSDTEQYFSENNPDHYALYNIRYVATPKDLQPKDIQPFWKKTAEGNTWILYAVDTDGYIAGGIRPAVVSADKTDYRSVVRLWMHSDDPKHSLFPQLTFDRTYPRETGLPNFRMTDEVTYRVPDGSLHNLFAEVPKYMAPGDAALTPTVTEERQDADMTFFATVTVPDGCTECVTVLRQTFHPSWQVSVDGKRADSFAVFPFYTAVRMDTPGVHRVTFSYRPSAEKKLLLFVSLVTAGVFIVITIRRYARLPRIRHAR